MSSYIVITVTGWLRASSSAFRAAISIVFPLPSSPENVISMKPRPGELPSSTSRRPGARTKTPHVVHDVVHEKREEDSHQQAGDAGNQHIRANRRARGMLGRDGPVQQSASLDHP